MKSYLLKSLAVVAVVVLSLGAMSCGKDTPEPKTNASVSMSTPKFDKDKETVSATVSGKIDDLNKAADAMLKSARLKAEGIVINPDNIVVGLLFGTNPNMVLPGPQMISSGVLAEAAVEISVTAEQKIKFEKLVTLHIPSKEVVLDGTYYVRAYLIYFPPTGMPQTIYCDPFTVNIKW